MSKKILVIDDEEILTKTFSRLLRRQGYEVVVAQNYDEAMHCIHAEAFDLIVTDIRMPGENGVQIIRSVQKWTTDKGTAMPPVIFITGFADEVLEIEARKLNPLAYLTKPFDAFQLLDMIKGRIGV